MSCSKNVPGPVPNNHPGFYTCVRTRFRGVWDLTTRTANSKTDNAARGGRFGYHFFTRALHARCTIRNRPDTSHNTLCYSKSDDNNNISVIIATPLTTGRPFLLADYSYTLNTGETASVVRDQDFVGTIHVRFRKNIIIDPTHVFVGFYLLHFLFFFLSSRILFHTRGRDTYPVSTQIPLPSGVRLRFRRFIGSAQRSSRVQCTPTRTV